MGDECAHIHHYSANGNKSKDKKFKPTIALDARRAKTQLAKVVDNSEELSKVNKEDAAALCARGGFLSSHRDSEHSDGPSQIATTDQPTSVVYSETESELDRRTRETQKNTKVNKEEQNAAESLLLQDVLDDSELGCIESCTEDKASTPRKEDRGKKWSKEDKMVRERKNADKKVQNEQLRREKEEKKLRELALINSFRTLKTRDGKISEFAENRAVRQRGASRQVRVGNRKRKGLHSRSEKAEIVMCDEELVENAVIQLFDLSRRTGGVLRENAAQRRPLSVEIIQIDIGNSEKNVEGNVREQESNHQGIFSSLR
ncbi:hypothetical protein DAPPUDRAFT_107031 [Daphnia pulex]|uniref:Uncharacterized protein n=1 Tax=Daphnia pulex TaxID=6669 RepID=E9GVR3_DAPPU|nr:hypothetical protein DAPPUDRAFT_107031 [Daphnia pulex]|eukprot:EFX76481.1 hypothetical protein DAPPUDRAFT_107031 [Daphnia pulex]